MTITPNNALIDIKHKIGYGDNDGDIESTHTGIKKYGYEYLYRCTH
jgi:hypothetical protein